MKQAVKKAKVAKDVLIDEIYAPSISQKSDKVKIQEATALHLEKTKSLSRYLEACGDCV